MKIIEDTIIKTLFFKITFYSLDDSIIISIYNRDNVTDEWEICDDYRINQQKFDNIKAKLIYLSMKYNCGD